MGFFRPLAVALAATVLVACKVQVNVPEQGGRVVSAGYSCSAGQQCMIDITDTSFTESFVAEPDSGYQFLGWKKAAAHLCGGQTTPCAVSSAPLASSAQFLALLSADITVYLEPQFGCATDAQGNADAGCGVYSKTITGQVTGPTVPNATVSVTLSGQTFSTTADANGYYSLELLSTNTAELVKIEASGNARSGFPAKFVSLVGSFDNLNESEPEPVTSMTTAVYARVIEALYGAEPVTLEELQTAQNSVSATEATGRAAAIMLIIDNPGYELPAGYADVLEFVTDRAGINSFISQVVWQDPFTFFDTEEDILNDSGVVEGFTAQTLPTRYLQLPTSNRGYLPRSGTILAFDTGSADSMSQFSFSYTFDATLVGTPGNVLSGIVEGRLQEDGDTIVISDFVSASLDGYPYVISDSIGIRAFSPGEPAVMSLSGDTLDFWVCPQGFTDEYLDGGDCPFGTEGGFLVSDGFELRDDVAGDASGSARAGVPQLGREYRDHDVDINRGGWHAQELLGADSGTGTAFESINGTPLPPVGYGWRIDSGELVLDFEQPSISYGASEDVYSLGLYPEEIDLLLAEQQAAGFLYVTYEERSAQSRLTRLNKGDQLDLVQVLDRVDRRYDPYDLWATTGETLQLQDLLYFVGYGESLRPAVGAPAIPFAIDCNASPGSICVTGTWGASYRYSPGVDYDSEETLPVAEHADILDFRSQGANRSVSGLYSGVAATWNVVDGKLEISYSDGWTQTVSIVTRLGLEYGVINEFSNGNDSYLTYDVIVKAETPPTFDQARITTAPGKIWNNEINNWIPGAFDSNGNRSVASYGQVLGFSFSGDGSGSNQIASSFDVDGDGNNDSVLETFPVSWSIESNSLKIDLGGGFFRYWYPIAETTVGSARQIHVLQVEEIDGQLTVTPGLRVMREIVPTPTDFVLGSE